MSHTLDRLAFFTRKTELFSNKHGVMNDDDRTWEHAYRSSGNTTRSCVRPTG